MNKSWLLVNHNPATAKPIKKHLMHSLIQRQAKKKKKLKKNQEIFHKKEVNKRLSSRVSCQVHLYSKKNNSFVYFPLQDTFK